MEAVQAGGAASVVMVSRSSTTLRKALSAQIVWGEIHSSAVELRASKETWPGEFQQRGTRSRGVGEDQVTNALGRLWSPDPAGVPVTQRDR